MKNRLSVFAAHPDEECGSRSCEFCKKEETKNLIEVKFCMEDDLRSEEREDTKEN